MSCDWIRSRSNLLAGVNWTISAGLLFRPDQRANICFSVANRVINFSPSQTTIKGLPKIGQTLSEGTIPSFLDVSWCELKITSFPDRNAKLDLLVTCEKSKRLLIRERSPFLPKQGLKIRRVDGVESRIFYCYCLQRQRNKCQLRRLWAPTSR